MSFMAFTVGFACGVVAVVAATEIMWAWYRRRGRV